MAAATSQPAASARLEPGPAGLRLSGHLDAATAGEIWRDAMDRAGGAGALVLDVSGLESCDAAGAVLLVEMERARRQGGGRLELRGLPSNVAEILEMVEAGESETPSPEAGRRNFFEALGSASIDLLLGVRETIAYVGALTLGLLQALYALLGGLAGQLSPGLMLLAGMFFFAMLGGRGMTDIRDYPQDQATRVQTLPKRYGVQRTAWFTAICLVIAFALSLAAYWTGEYRSIYLYLDVVFVTVGLICAGLFVLRPTPRLAHVLTLVFMMGMGSLICLAMILGSVQNRGKHQGWQDDPVMMDATFGALVWEDVNGNGVQDEGKDPISGVVVDLVARSGQGQYHSLTTDEAGRVFDLVPGASYDSMSMQLVVPDGYEPTTPTRVQGGKAEFGIRRLR